MDGAGRGEPIDNQKTVEDAAGLFMACGMGPGLSWLAEAPDALLDNVDEHGRHVRNLDVLLAAGLGEVEEQAGRYNTRLAASDRRLAPNWTKAERAQANTWARANRMSLRRGGGIGQFQSWKHHDSWGAAPSNPADYKAAGALTDAGLAGPLEALLRLVTLQDETQWPTVLRYLQAKGYRPAPCRTAMRKVLFPYARVVNVDSEADCHAETYRNEVKAARKVIRRWLKTACWRFMLSHGWPGVEYKRTLKKPPKRARPRFEGGIDWKAMPPAPWSTKSAGEPTWYKKLRREEQQTNRGRVGEGAPAPCRVLTGEFAIAYCRKHPAQPRLEKFYRSLVDREITEAHDYWARELARGIRAEKLDAETPCEPVY